MEAMQHAAALYRAGRLDEAEEVAAALLEREPRHFYALHLLATLAAYRADWPRALELGTRALDIGPGHVEALCNRGAALRMLHRFDEALADYDRALALQPQSHVAHANRGVALAAANRHAQALLAFDRALALQPDYPRARYGRAISRLMLGDFAGGWEDYEWRWSGSENAAVPRDLGLPQLEPGDLGRGRRTALWAEQGIGDQLLFATLAAELAARGEHFVLEVDARLLPALRRAHPDWALVARDEPRAFAGCDRQLPLGSLARLLRPDAASFARQPGRLLAADPAARAQWRQRLGEPGLRWIGISWRSFQPRARSYYEGRKNAPLTAFAALARDPAIRLVDLQYGDTAAERAQAEAAGVALAHPELDRFNDIEGLLALIDACDAVVTTSNATAHFAGTLGKRTLLVYPCADPPFHYWVPDAQGRCRWHPSVEVVSAPELRTWEGLLERAAARLGGGDLPPPERAA